MTCPHEILPHRYPFIFLDRVDIIEGDSGKGLKLIATNEPYVNEDGILSRVFIIEAMAQLSGIVSGKRGGGVLAGIRGFEYFSDVFSGETLIIESKKEGSFGGLYIFNCRASVGQREVAEGKVILQLE